MKRWKQPCLSLPPTAAKCPQVSGGDAAKSPQRGSGKTWSLLDWLGKSPHRLSLALLLLSTRCYWASLFGDFVFDDGEAVSGNPDVRGRTPLLALWSNDFWGRPLASPSSHKSWRPLTTMMFRLEWWAWDGSPVGFHALNLILHGVCTILAAAVFRIVAKDVGMKDKRLPTLASLLFAAHPIHSEVVANIAGRSELLSGIAFLAAFLAYRRGERSLVVTGLAGVAMLCKEQGVTVMGVCAAYELYIRSKLSLSLIRERRAQQAADRANNNINKTSFWSTEVYPVLRRVAGLVLGGMALVTLRLWVLGFQPPVFSEPDNPSAFLSSMWMRTLNYAYLYCLNAWLLLAPADLCFDYSMGCVPLIMGWDLRLLVVAGGGAAVMAAAVRVLRMEDCAIKRLLTSSTLLLLIPFLPASHLLLRVGFVLAERVLFLPSLGFALLTAAGMLAAVPKRWMERAAGVVVLLYAAKGHQRSGDWVSEVRLFSAGARVCPLNAKVHYNLGKVLADSGDPASALQRYRLALDLEPAYEQAMNNLANLLKDQGHLEEARDLLSKATALRPGFAAAWMNLGIVQAALNHSDAAESAYLRALRERRVYPDALFNLGNLYLETGRKWSALAAWRNATVLKPRHAKAWVNQLVLLDAEEEWSEAVATGYAAVSALPSEPGLRFSLGSALGKLARLEESEQQLLLAIRLSGDPPPPAYVANLGVLYHRWRRLKEAEELYAQALDMDPGLGQVKKNLALLRKDLKKL